jgi:uncharacterized protein with HEPN domain
MPSTPSRSIAAALRDILENIKLARSFVDGLSLDDFRADRRSSYAVVRCLEIISEASRKLPADLKERHPKIPWKEIAGAGSVYRHHYVGVRDELVWKTVQEDLEALRLVAEKDLKA